MNLEKLKPHYEEQGDNYKRNSIHAKIGEVALNYAPEGFLTANGIVRENDLKRRSVESRIKRLKKEGLIKGQKYLDERGLLRDFYSPDEINQICDSLVELNSLEIAPEGWMTITTLQKEKNWKNKTKIFNLIRNLEEDGEIEGVKYRHDNVVGNGKPDIFYSPIDISRICRVAECSVGTKKKKAPEDYMTIRGMSYAFGINNKTLKEKIDNIDDIEGSEFADEHGNNRIYYSPEQQEQIRLMIEDYLEKSEPPDGYMPIKKMIEKYGMNRKSLNSIIDELKKEEKIKGEMFKNGSGRLCYFYSQEELDVILTSVEKRDSCTSIPENTVAYYLVYGGINVQQNIRPDWLKNPDSGRNLEIDIFVDPPGIGIEYDGCFYHQDVGRDIKKDSIAQKSGHRIIHIREDGCPEMPEGSVCINRKNNTDDTDLGECIKKCFETIGIPVPDINVARDKKDIMAFMRQRVLDKLDSARTFEELSVVS